MSLVQEYFKSAKAIEFIWLFTTFILFVNALLIKFVWGKDIHPVLLPASKTIVTQPQQQKIPVEQEKKVPHFVINNQPENQYIVTDENYHRPTQAAQQLPQQSNIHPPLQSNINSLDSVPIVSDSTPQSSGYKISRSFQKMIDIYLPLIAVSLISVGQLASFTFAAVCVYFAMFCAFLFTIIMAFDNHQSKSMPVKIIIVLSYGFYHIWVLALFINFLAYDEE